jgi:hypothetical protein
MNIWLSSLKGMLTEHTNRMDWKRTQGKEQYEIKEQRHKIKYSLLNFNGPFPLVKIRINFKPADTRHKCNINITEIYSIFQPLNRKTTFH